MGSTHKGPDGVDTYPADDWDIDSYRRAEEMVAQMRIPQFLREDNPHDRLFVAALDGTGNSMHKEEPDRHSVVAKLHQQVNARHVQGNTSIATGYVHGTYTQDNWLVRKADGAFGHSFEDRVETAYWQLCDQARKWLDEDPDAQIRVIVAGFSRGAEQAAALTRLIHERGIMDPRLAEVTWNEQERIITSATYHGEPLVPPGQTLQAALVFDPVSTGVTGHDRRFAPSVVSAFQITAQDEPRDQFKANMLVPPGISEDWRSYNALVGGAHSNVGDTYRQNGLGTLSHNLGVAYFNRVSDQPLLEKRPEPDDRSMYVVHRSEQHGALWSTRGFRDGMRDLRDDLAPASACQPRQAVECRQPEPTDPDNLRRAEALMSDATSPYGQGTRPDAARGDSLDAIFERLTDAALLGDRDGMRAAVDAWHASPGGQLAAREGREYLAQQQELAEQQDAARVQGQQAPALAR
jgi:hypothetical protein